MFSTSEGYNDSWGRGDIISIQGVLNTSKEYHEYISRNHERISLNRVGGYHEYIGRYHDPCGRADKTRLFHNENP